MSNRFIISTSTSPVYVRSVSKVESGIVHNILLVVGLVAIFMAVATAAYADRISTHCSRNWYGFTCSTSINEHKAVPDLDPEAIEFIRKREAKWEAFCKPEPVTGEDGLTRMVYARKGCDLGRID